MKKLLFLILFVSPIQAQQVVLNIPDNDIKIVANDVVDPVQWIKDAWAGKLANCKKRLVKQEIDQSIEAGEALPAGEDAIVQKAFSRPGYKNRVDREKTKIIK